MESLKNEVEPLLSDSRNPCKAIWDEFMAGKITCAEKLEAIYIYALTDKECLDAYRFKAYPTEPQGLAEARIDFSIKFNKVKEADKSRVRYEFSKQCRAEFPAYFESYEIAHDVNHSNLGFLRDMYEFFRERNQAYVARLTPLIQEHEENK